MAATAAEHAALAYPGIGAIPVFKPVAAPVPAAFPETVSAAAIAVIADVIALDPARTALTQLLIALLRADAIEDPADLTAPAADSMEFHTVATEELITVHAPDAAAAVPAKPAIAPVKARTPELAAEQAALTVVRPAVNTARPAAATARPATA